MKIRHESSIVSSDGLQIQKISSDESQEFWILPTYLQR